jgi:hypothetical protein
MLDDVFAAAAFRPAPYTQGLFFSTTGECLIVPHKEFLVFLKDILGNATGHSDDGAVVAVLPAVFEASADRLQTNDSEFFTFGNRFGFRL